MDARVTLAWASGVVLLAAGGIAWLTAAGPVPRDDTTVSGYYSPSDPIVVKNLTVPDGTYEVGYRMQVLFSPQAPGVVLRCWIVDTSGRLEFYDGGVQEVSAGGWTEIAYRSVYELPDLTLGVRCRPSERGVLSVVFRDATLFATEVRQ